MKCRFCDGSGEQHSVPLRFEELEVGETFIAYPGDGDDSGHGGVRRGSYVLCKIAEDRGAVHDNYTKVRHGQSGHIPAGMHVLRVLAESSHG